MPIEIIIPDESMRDLCEHCVVADKILGQEIAKRLRSRIADLQAATNVSDVTAGRPTPAADGSASISYALGSGARLVVEPADDPIPRDDRGAINWAQVKKIRVTLQGQKQ